MGSYSIWAWASVAYGIVCAGIYTLIARYRKFRGIPWRRFIVWSVIFTAIALALTGVLYHFLSD